MLATVLFHSLIKNAYLVLEVVDTDVEVYLRQSCGWRNCAVLRHFPDEAHD